MLCVKWGVGEFVRSRLCVHVPLYMRMCVIAAAVIVGSRSVSCCAVAQGCGSHEGWRER